MNKNIAIRYKQSDGYDTLYPNSSSEITSFDPNNTITNQTNQFNTVHNQMYSTNVQDAIEELNDNIASHGRSFEKLDIPTYIPYDYTEIAYSDKGDRICIINNDLSYAWVSVDGSKTWESINLFPNLLGDPREIVYDSTTNSFWILQIRGITQLLCSGNTVTSKTNIPPNKVISTGMLSFGVYSDSSYIYFIIGCVEDSSQPIAWKGKIPLSSGQPGNIGNDSYWSHLISRSHPEDGINMIQCNPNGYAVVTAAIGSSYIPHIYTYNFMNGSIADQSVSASFYLGQIVVGDTGNATNVIVLGGGIGTSVLYQKPSVSTTWYKLDLAFPPADDGASILEIGKLYFVNNHWCGQFNVHQTSSDKGYFGISDTTSITNISKKWYIKAVQNMMPNEYKNIINNADFSVIEYQNMDHTKNVVLCCGVCPNFHSTDPNNYFSIITSTGFIMGVNDQGIRKSEEISPDFLLTTTPMSYTKIIKGHKDTYLVLSCYATNALDGKSSGSVLSHSLDCKTWISYPISSYEKITDIMYIGNYYYWAGADFVSEMAALYCMDITTKNVVYWNDATYSETSNVQAFAQIATNNIGVLIAVTNSLKPRKGSTIYSHLYASAIPATSFALKSRKSGGWEGCIYTGCGNTYMLMHRETTIINEITGQVYTTANGVDLTAKGSAIKGVNNEARIIGKDESLGTINVFNGVKPWSTVSNGSGWNDLSNSTTDWNNNYVCPQLNINGYYWLVKDGKLYYTTTNPLSTAFNLDAQSKVSRMPTESANVHTILNMEDKIFALVGKDKSFKYNDSYYSENEVWISTTT